MHSEPRDRRLRIELSNVFRTHIMRKYMLLPFLLTLNFQVSGQTSLRANVLDVETHLSDQRDLIITVSNMSKMQSTLDTVAADLGAGCLYEAAIGAVPPGTVRTVTLATQQQLLACDARTLREFKAGQKMRIVPLGMEAAAVPPRIPGRPPVRPVNPGPTVGVGVPLPAEPADSHVFKISVSGSTAEERFSTVGNWLLRVVR